MSPSRRDYPVGIPVRPPPGWRPPARPASVPSLGGLFLRIGLVGLMVLVCLGVGFLVVQTRHPPSPEKRAAKAQPAPKVETLAETPPREETPLVATPRPAPPSPAQSPSPPLPMPTPPPNKATLTYETHILPIMERACTSCHGTGRIRGGLDLRTYRAMARGGDNGPSIQPGNPEGSPLYDSVVTGRMPPGKSRKLSEAEKKVLREWIAGGAQSEP